ncbi:MAG: polymer-forming cytoskeletal protein, partial [Candidatus Omnitrophica bacterium]|nr:polymer-forming cytoskeletal protein [Candidatus Omnitrophota bacterium]
MGFGVRKENRSFEEGSRVEINPPMQGNVVFRERPVDLHINGRFKGSLEFCGTLTAGEQSELEADISGDNVIILGKVKGDIKAHKLLVLMPTAVVYGNISAPKLNIVEGAVFQGNC